MSRCTSREFQCTSREKCKICDKLLPREGLINITNAFTSDSTIAETLGQFAGLELASHSALNEGSICIEDCYGRLRAGIEFQYLLKNVFERHLAENGTIDEGDKIEWESNSMEIANEHDIVGTEVGRHLEQEEHSPVTDNVKLLGRPFVIPKQDYIKTHMKFNNLEYVELSGPMCCGCDFIAKSIENLMDHITSKHDYRTNDSNDSYVCDICYEPCKDDHQLRAHRKWLLNTEIFLCKCCSYGFTSKDILKQHMSMCIGQIDCATCDNNVECVEDEEQAIHNYHVTKTEDYDDHSDLHNAMSAAIVQQPKVILEVTQSSAYGCCFLRCNETFDREIDLHRHVQELHAVRQRIQRSERTSDQYVCDTCELNFKSLKTLQRHRNSWKLKQNNVCSHCGKGFVTPGALKDHVQLVHSGTLARLSCECCGKQFKKKSHLKLHLVTHQQNRRYRCGQCDARFHFAYQLKKHQQAVHTTDFPYECNHCNRKLSNKHGYDLHMRMHTGEKPYACRHDCGRKFAHATDRRRHEMVAHTGEKPHRCSSCSMAYVRRRELHQHYRHFPAHDPDTTDYQT